MSKNEIEDELRPEYDLQSLQIRKLGGCPRIRLSNELPLLSFGEILNFPEIKFKIDPIFSVLTL
jgi:hypothetical protein